MSAPFGPFVLTLDGITQQMRSIFETFIDPRKGKNTSDTIAEGKVLYRNAFATSLALDSGNVAEVIEAGRSRWKNENENENNNTLKTRGYHFEHNYGHGKKHRSSLLASLIILAFSPYY
jgi:hypothetical protein